MSDEIERMSIDKFRILDRVERNKVMLDLAAECCLLDDLQHELYLRSQELFVKYGRHANIQDLVRMYNNAHEYLTRGEDAIAGK